MESGFLAESGCEKFNQRGDSLILAIATGFNHNLCAFACGKHGDAEHALGVDPFIVARQPDLTGKPAGKLAQLGGCA
jgi:hypothetical protein